MREVLRVPQPAWTCKKQFRGRMGPVPSVHPPISRPHCRSHLPGSTHLPAAGFPGSEPEVHFSIPSSTPGRRDLRVRPIYPAGGPVGEPSGEGDGPPACHLRTGIASVGPSVQRVRDISSLLGRDLGPPRPPAEIHGGSAEGSSCRLFACQSESQSCGKKNRALGGTLLEITFGVVQSTNRQRSDP